MFNVRYATKDEVEAVADRFSLCLPENEGNTFIVCESDDEIVGFAQLYGNEILFLESIRKGAGRAMVEFLKREFDHLYAIRADEISRGFWQRMGFSLLKMHSRFDIDLEWWAE